MKYYTEEYFQMKTMPWDSANSDQPFRLHTPSVNVANNSIM